MTLLLWDTIEMNVIINTACIATLRPLYIRFCGRQNVSNFLTPKSPSHSSYWRRSKRRRVKPTVSGLDSTARYLGATVPMSVGMSGEHLSTADTARETETIGLERLESKSDEEDVSNSRCNMDEGRTFPRRQFL